MKLILSFPICNVVQLYSMDNQVSLPISFLEKPHVTFLKNSYSKCVPSPQMPSLSVLEWQTLNILQNSESHISFRQVFPRMFWQAVSGSLLSAKNGCHHVVEACWAHWNSRDRCYLVEWKEYPLSEKLLFRAAGQEYRICHTIAVFNAGSPLFHK